MNGWGWRRVAALAATNVVLFSALCAALEGLCRFVPALAPKRAERARFWQYDARLGWKHRANQSGVFRHPDFRVRVDINSSGLRDREYPFDRTQRRRMLVLGDSYGWGFGVEQDEIFSERLERQMPGWEIINASVSGYGTDQELIYFMAEGHRFAPDVVLLLFSVNDFQSNVSEEDCWYNKPRFILCGGRLWLTNTPVPRATMRQALDRLIIGRTCFLRHVYKGALRVAWRIRSKQPAPGVAEEVHVTQALLRELNRCVQDRGGRLVLVSVPMSEARAGWVRAVADEEQIPHLGLTPFFANAAEPLEFAHDRHWNAKGHAIAARAVEAFLEEQGIFGPSDGDGMPERASGAGGAPDPKQASFTGSRPPPPCLAGGSVCRLLAERSPQILFPAADARRRLPREKAEDGPASNPQTDSPAPQGRGGFKSTALVLGLDLPFTHTSVAH